MDPISILNSIRQGIQFIQETCDKAKQNPAQCRRLLSRIQLVVHSVTPASQNAQQLSHASQKALSDLHECVEACKQWMVAFQARSSLRRLARSSKDQQELAALNDRLTVCANDLKLSIDMARLFDKRDDINDLHSDFNSMQQHHFGTFLHPAAAGGQEYAANSSSNDNEPVPLQMRRIASFKRMKETELAQFQAMASSPRAVSPPASSSRHAASKSAVPEFPFCDLKFLKALGRGGFGDVWLARVLATDEEVVVKILHFPDLTQDAAARFTKEAEIHYSMKHPNVVTLRGACTEPDNLSLVMEYCKLGSLLHFLRCNRDLSWPHKARMAQEMVRAVHYLHQECQVIHRDIKALNFLVTQSDAGQFEIDYPFTVKICDFGMAKPKLETRMHSSTHLASGTIHYMAPELIDVACPPCEATDIYSLGIVLWVLATGVEPYGDIENPHRISAMVINGKRPELRGVPRAWQDIISPCWQKNPSLRPKSTLLLQQIDALVAHSSSGRWDQVSLHSTHSQQSLFSLNGSDDAVATGGGNRSQMNFSASSSSSSSLSLLSQQEADSEETKSVSSASLQNATTANSPSQTRTRGLATLVVAAASPVPPRPSIFAQAVLSSGLDQLRRLLDEHRFKEIGFSQAGDPMLILNAAVREVHTAEAPRASSGPGSWMVRPTFLWIVVELNNNKFVLLKMQFTDENGGTLSLHHHLEQSSEHRKPKEIVSAAGTSFKLTGASVVLYDCAFVTVLGYAVRFAHAHRFGGAYNSRALCWSAIESCKHSAFVDFPDPKA